MRWRRQYHPIPDFHSVRPILPWTPGRAGRCSQPVRPGCSALTTRRGTRRRRWYHLTKAVARIPAIGPRLFTVIGAACESRPVATLPAPEKLW